MNRRIPRGPTLLLLASAFAAALGGCGVGGAIGRGIGYYQDGHFDAAMSVWSQVEPLQHRMNRKGYVRYLVFRGLTHYQLRQMGAARRFLMRGAAVYRQGPARWLPRYAVMQLRTALAELRRTGAGAPRGAKPGASPPPSSTPPSTPPSAPSRPRPAPEQPAPPPSSRR